MRLQRTWWLAGAVVLAAEAEAEAKEEDRQRQSSPVTDGSQPTTLREQLVVGVERPRGRGLPRR